MTCWLGYLSTARFKCFAYGLAGAIYSIVSVFVKIDNGFAFWCRLTQVVLEKRPLNGCFRIFISDDRFRSKLVRQLLLVLVVAKKTEKC